MASILPVSDLRNYNEVLKNCRAGEPVFLTKNGKGRFVVLDIEDYEHERAEKKLLMKLQITLLVVSDLQEIKEDKTPPAAAPRPLLLLIQIFHLKVLFQLSSLIYPSLRCRHACRRASLPRARPISAFHQVSL